MTSCKKTVFSLLISVILCSALVVLAFPGFFNITGTAFHQNAVIAGMEKWLNVAEETVTEYLDIYLEHFRSYVNASGAEPEQADMTGGLIVAGAPDLSLMAEILLLAVVFLTVFLVIRLLFSLRKDDDRLHREKVAEKSESAPGMPVPDDQPDDVVEAELIPVEEIREFSFIRGMMSHYRSEAVIIETAQETIPITESADGVFRISENLDTSGIRQNAEFKHLVDSILFD